MAVVTRVVRCWVKSRNERNLTFSCHHLVGHSERTASDKLEEGGDDVKSLMALTCWATHVLQWYLQQEARLRGQANPKRYLSSDCTLQLEVHEAGITSNRGSACHGECVPGSCTHRPSHHGSWFYLKARFQTLDHGIVSD